MSAVFEVGGKIPSAPGGLVFSNGISVPTAAQPTFSPIPGTYSGTQTVTISCSTPSSTIYYTTDGSAPTFPITGTTLQYTGSLTVSATETIKAIGTAAGFNNSGIATGSYTITAGSGFLPAGHFINAKQAMLLVYPQPDGTTNTFARHRWAYYDGTNSVQYQIPLGVAFGAFPYVFSLDSGSTALGMSITSPFWNTAWTSFQQALTSGYGYLTWTPSGSVAGHTVTITVTDQQLNTLTITFTVSTSSSISNFVFIDSVHGSDSTGTGSISAPWQTFAKVNGSLYSTNVNGGAICYLRQGTYAIAPQSDSGNSTNLNSGWATCQLNTARKPSAFIGFPGDTAPILTMTAAVIGAAQVGATPDANDLFMQGLNPNSFNASQASFRFFWGTQGHRITFDQIQWTNSGYGASAGSNATGYFIDGAGGGAMSNVFINGTSETNRQSGNAGNNYGGCSFYTTSNSLVQGNSIIDPTLTIDEAYQPKSDVSNTSWRGNTVIVASCQFAFSPLQAVVPSYNNFEISYNIWLGGTTGLAVPVSFTSGQGFVYTNLWCYRNNVQASGGINSGDPGVSGNGPYVFENNAVQTSASVVSGNFVTQSGNLYAASGLLDGTTGNLTSGHSGSVGTIGAQIA